MVDVGSGKGYFASEMSLRHKIPVVGFDSSDTNTHGASQRDKKLSKKWVGLERRKKLKQVCFLYFVTYYILASWNNVENNIV